MIGSILESLALTTHLMCFDHFCTIDIKIIELVNRIAVLLTWNILNMHAKRKILIPEERLRRSRTYMAFKDCGTGLVYHTQIWKRSSLGPSFMLSQGWLLKYFD